MCWETVLGLLGRQGGFRAIDSDRGTGVRMQRRAKTARPTAKAIRKTSKGLVKVDPCLIDSGAAWDGISSCVRSSGEIQEQVVGRSSGRE
jgi:hypothetical protein